MGAIFYFGSRRRVDVRFDDRLRAATIDFVWQMRTTVALGVIPAHTAQRQRCRGCSLIDICLPEETELLCAQPEMETKKP